MIVDEGGWISTSDWSALPAAVETLAMSTFNGRPLAKPASVISLPIADRRVFADVRKWSHP